MYKELMDESNDMYAVQLDVVKEKRVQTGYFEANILCAECDNVVLGKLENYGNTILYGGRLKSPVQITHERNQHGVEYVTCRGLDYQKFKLFLLSLLWRMSIAKGDFFRYVNLGSHEEILRRMIFEGDPGAALDYPCFVSTYRKHKQLPKELVSQPIRVGTETDEGYSIVIAGMLYMYFLPGHSKIGDMREAYVDESGTFRLIHMPEDNSRRILNKYFNANIF